VLPRSWVAGGAEGGGARARGRNVGGRNPVAEGGGAHMRKKPGRALLIVG
jgi:hypothetical protein